MACGYCYGSLLNAKKDHFPTQINIQGLNKVRIKKIGIVIFDNIERLDFDGPMGVFGWINKLGEGELTLSCYHSMESQFEIIY